MRQVIQIGYIFTMMAGMMPFAMELMTRRKNLAVRMEPVKSGETLVFLSAIVIFNLCDFLIIFLGSQWGKESVSCIYIFENVLEVGLVYFFTEIERKWAGKDKELMKGLFFVSAAVIILWFDILYTTEFIHIGEDKYAAAMAALNCIPLAAMIYCGARYAALIYEKSSKDARLYMVVYNAVFAFLCMVVTAGIIDSRTTWDYFKNDKEIYMIFWLIFNVFNTVFMLNCCKKSGPEKITTSVETHFDSIAVKYGLSEREKEIARLICQGKSNKEMADQLFLSVNTVKVHTSKLYRKLGAAGRLQAVEIIGGMDIKPLHNRL